MKCTKIEYIDEDLDLCDLEIEGGSNNYIAEGIVVHNTWCCFGYHPEFDTPIITSKGLSCRGVAFKLNEKNKDNVYIRALEGTMDDKGDNVLARALNVFGNLQPIYILGEVYGRGIQDLQYGTDNPQFRVFDIYIGQPGSGGFVHACNLETITDALGIPMVPMLYRGPFSKEVMMEYTDGDTTLEGDHMREGIVITPMHEREDRYLGRVKLKSVSEKYLLRKGKVTEYN